MIGVAVQPDEREVATEFFELFKTPWEFYQSDKQYDVVLSTSDDLIDNARRLLIVFDGGRFDPRNGTDSRNQFGILLISDEGRRFPIYGSLTTFPGESQRLLKKEGSQESVALVNQIGVKTILRVGYDLFGELRYLLTTGQPASNAGIPTLEVHIGCLRDWITRVGVPSVEIPPSPDRYNFVGCLTHDIDHPALRNHWCDHTMFGFLYRSIAGTCIDCCLGRRQFRSLWTNWQAALRLPLVHLGVARDCWADFDRYLEIEQGHGTTFFVIPRGNYAGRTRNGPAPSKRACRYDLEQLLPKLTRIISAGREIGVHGLDAWLDSESGRKERESVADRLQSAGLGVRMHWLFFDEHSPAVLEQAGFSYDSSVGFRETIGYRTGTAQVYKPLRVKKLLELPLHVMDTALFYPGYLNVKEDEARRLVRTLLHEAERNGGALTINWHDRSIAPERLWGDFYLDLLDELKRRGAWMPNAAQAVAWFRKRRAATVEWSWSGIDSIMVRARLDMADALPGLKIRIFKPRAQSLSEPIATRNSPGFVEKTFDKVANFDLTI
jgi:hypothetical protein